MSEFRPSKDAPAPASAARCNPVNDRTLRGLLLLTLVRATEVLAGDHVSIAGPGAPLDPLAADVRPSPVAAARSMDPPRIMDPDFLALPRIVDTANFSASDFRPRRHTVFDRDPTVSAFDDAPMLQGTTVWQRMAEYKSHDRVRLLTLWETNASTVSLQAGNHGDRSLQWSSRLMNHNGSTRGLLDRLFSVSLAGAGNSLRHTAHSTGSPAAAKPAGNPTVAGLK